MKFLKFLSIFLAAAFIFTACEKEYSYEDGTAKGSLKKDDASGDCLPQTVNGTYVKDTVLKAAINFVDLQVNVTETGAYDIRTDTVNGYYFRAVGSTANTGLNTIRLIGAGKPIAASIDEFTVAFDTSHCTFSVQVTATAVTTGAFILGTAADHCTGISVQGTYTASTAMTATNKVSVPITITTPGTFTLTATPATTDNGVTFSVAGTLVSNGTATVDLAASGTPAAAGAFVYNLSDGTNTCTFTVTYGSAAPPATFTIDCTAATFTGTYQAGASATGNTVTISATPTTTGSYSITTPVVNGVSFSGTGTFSTTAAQPVVLTATGTAGATTGPVSYTATGGASTCTFSVTYTAAAGPAAFAINCGTAVINGDYYRGRALTAANTIVLPVTVTTAGSYTVSATASGVTFQGTGTFPNTNAGQTITLSPSPTANTSTAGGDVVFTTTGATTNCSFTVTFDFITAALDGGTPINFNFDDTAFYTTDPSLPGFNILVATGYSTATGNEQMEFDIAFPGTGTITSGTYNVNGTTYAVYGGYTDASSNAYEAITDGTTQPNPFTVVIAPSSTATRIIGTFSGNLTDAASVVKVVSGSFNLKVH